MVDGSARCCAPQEDWPCATCCPTGAEHSMTPTSPHPATPCPWHSPPPPPPHTACRLFNGKAAEGELKGIADAMGGKHTEHTLLRHNLVVFRGGEGAVQVGGWGWGATRRGGGGQAEGGVGWLTGLVCRKKGSMQGG
jgi:hypothetical protein